MVSSPNSWIFSLKIGFVSQTFFVRLFVWLFAGMCVALFAPTNGKTHTIDNENNKLQSKEYRNALIEVGNNTNIHEIAKKTLWIREVIP